MRFRSPNIPWLGQGKENVPRLPEPRTEGAVTKKRRRPIHLYVMMSAEERVLIRERMTEGGAHPQHEGLYAENGPQWVCGSMLTCHPSRSWCRSNDDAPTI